ncbi:hypothetical protein AURDEDRAFT_170864 [Auricularia subglabra TFB-10046 SS5]|nr:hypothetical protein AURDEDRAFT_170864 [Auricularia subglabra TFB-10046 SS5]
MSYQPVQVRLFLNTDSFLTNTMSIPQPGLRIGDLVLVIQNGHTYRATLMAVNVPTMTATVQYENDQTAQVAVGNIRPAAR